MRQRERLYTTALGTATFDDKSRCAPSPPLPSPSFRSFSFGFKKWINTSELRWPRGPRAAVQETRRHKGSSRGLEASVSLAVGTPGPQGAADTS